MARLLQNFICHIFDQRFFSKALNLKKRNYLTPNFKFFNNFYIWPTIYLNRGTGYDWPGQNSVILLLNPASAFFKRFSTDILGATLPRGSKM